MRNGSEAQSLFSHLNQGVIHFACNNNTLNFSSLHEFSQPVVSAGFAIKYVIEGTERYIINKQAYKVCEDSYLLMNGTKEGYVEIESKKNTKGICVYIDDTVIAEIVASFQRPDAPYTDPGLADFLLTDHFLENQYSAGFTRLGKTIRSISQTAQHNTFSQDDINQELFYRLAEDLLADQLTVFKQMRSITTIKPITRKDLYRRVLKGRDFMDASFQTPLTIEQVAKEAAMSEYHFFRLFRTVFNLSPHQYILQKRLDYGKRLIEEQCPVSAAALDCGFADIHAFSKAFKNRFGIAPSLLQQRN